MKAGVSVLQAARAARSACVNTRCWCVILAASTTGMTEPHDAEMAAMPFNARVHQVFGVPYIKQEFHKQARKPLPQFPQERVKKCISGNPHQPLPAGVPAVLLY